ncbi:hypothetical protein D3C86_893040 [compost metagenome]
MGAGVEPGESTAEALYMQVATLQVGIVDVGDFQLCAGRRFDRLGDVDHIVVIEIQPGNGVAGFGFLGLFFDGKSAAIVVEINHAVALGVVYPIPEHSGAARAFCCVLQLPAKIGAVEDVVTEDQAH